MVRARKRNVLVGDSLTPTSDRVVEVGVEIAKRQRADLHLVHAFPMPSAYFMAPSALHAVYAPLLEVEDKRRRQQLAEQLERLHIAPDDVSSLVAAGQPHRLLSERAHQIPADLIVIGAHDGEGADGLGSHAERVLRKATCPVLVVRGDAVSRPARILVPVDLSELCGRCVERACELLDGLGARRRTELTALFVLTHMERGMSEQLTPEQVERFAGEELEQWIGNLDTGRAGRWRTKVRVGEPRAEILQELAEEPSDLVMIATHGRSGFERFILGSVASTIAQKASSSVLVVPPVSEEMG